MKVVRVTCNCYYSSNSLRYLQCSLLCWAVLLQHISQSLIVYIISFRKMWLWSDIQFSVCTAEYKSADVFPKQLSKEHTSTDSLVPNSELLKELKLWYRRIFSHRKNWLFLAENMIEDYTAKQSEWKFLVGRLPRMEPQEIFKRKKIGSKPDKHEVHFKILLLEINM